MPYQRKTRDLFVVQTVTAEETLREARARLREYRENEPQYPHRIKTKREPV
jgi:DNA polymerase IIIc chi subunit